MLGEKRTAKAATYLCLYLIFFAGPVSAQNTEEIMPDKKIRFSGSGYELVFVLYDNQTSRDFLALLPLTMEFKDYAGTEKISYPPSKLSTAGAPEGADPRMGDLCYYAPWGDLCIFYRDYQYSPGLIKLGYIIEGKDNITRLGGKVRVEIISQE